MEIKNPTQAAGTVMTPPQTGPVPQKKVSVIRTMRVDVTEAVKKQNETLVSIALAEERKKAAERGAKILAAQRQAEIEGSRPPSRRGRYILVVVILLIVGGFFLGYKYLIPAIKNSNLGSIFPAKTAEKATQNTPTPTTPIASPQPITQSLIPAQSEISFTIDKASPSKTFALVSADRTSGDITGWEVKNIVFKDTPAISANRLFTLAGVPTPEMLSRSLGNSFMAGFVVEEGLTIPTPFFVLKTSGYATARSGMLSWESKLPKLFDTIFGTNIESGLSETSKTRDIVLMGRDARVLEIAPNIGMAYTFADSSTIIITASRTAVEKLIPLLKR